MPAPAAIISQLCLNCGLCCNGALFRDVELQPGDDAAFYSSQGLAVEGVKTKVRFPQPCAALCADNRCRIHADRPTHCRDFECGVLMAVLAGSMDIPAALRTIGQARRSADRVLRLLRELGDAHEHLPLGRRFQQLTRRLEKGLPDEDAAATYAELTLAVHDLDQLVHRAFLKRV